MKKVLEQDCYFSTRLPYANEKITERYLSMVKTKNNATQDKIAKLQQLKGKVNQIYNFIKK